jgi:dihydropteroate synthase
MLPLTARAGTPYALMHRRGHSTGMRANAVYDDVVTDVVDALRARVDAALRAGVPVDCLIVDPGLGFARHAEHNWRLFGRLREVAALGRPVLVGAARKSFLGHRLGGPEDGAAPAGAPAGRGHLGGVGPGRRSGRLARARP